MLLHFLRPLKNPFSFKFNKSFKSNNYSTIGYCIALKHITDKIEMETTKSKRKLFTKN